VKAELKKLNIDLKGTIMATTDSNILSKLDLTKAKHEIKKED
jgi:hypothetical protein